MGRAEAAVAEARLWLGTPYVHQAAVRGRGRTVLGLLRGVWRALYGAEPETIPAYTQDWAEPGNTEELWQAAARWLVEVPRREVALGDVLLFRMRDWVCCQASGYRQCGWAGGRVYPCLYRAWGDRKPAVGTLVAPGGGEI